MLSATCCKAVANLTLGLKLKLSGSQLRHTWDTFAPGSAALLSHLHLDAYHPTNISIRWCTKARKRPRGKSGRKGNDRDTCAIPLRGTAVTHVRFLSAYVVSSSPTDAALFAQPPPNDFSCRVNARYLRPVYPPCIPPHHRGDKTNREALKVPRTAWRRTLARTRHSSKSPDLSP